MFEESDGHFNDFVPPSPSPAPRTVSVEEHEPTEENTYQSMHTNRYIESYPGKAGEGTHKSKTQFEEWLESQEHEGKKPWDPFASKEEWELACWLIKNVGQSSTDEYLKLQIVREVEIL